MGVTSGFLRLDRVEFRFLEADQTAFARRAQDRDELNGYLEMDKAGYELLCMFDPLNVESENVESPYPNIASILGKGRVIFSDLDLGFGPAQVVDEHSLRQSEREFNILTVGAFLKLANNEIVQEMLMGDATEHEFREYHWSYLQSLRDFVKEAVEMHMVVVRY